MGILLIIIHFLALSLGIGGSIANLVIGAKAAKADPAARPFMAGASLAIGKIATGSLIVLWLSGIAMVYTGWDGWGSLPRLFWVKITAVLALSICSALMNAEIIRAGRTKTPPPPAKMRLLGRIGALSAVTALVLAALAFEPTA